MKKQILTLIFLLITSVGFAQIGIGTTTSANPNSILELASPNKGLLMPRLALTGTTNAAPLTAHVTGIVVYNTATAGDVTPGLYANDGTKWVRVGTGNTSDTTPNFYTANSILIGDRIVTQGSSNLTFAGLGNFIKTGGNVGIGTATPTTNLSVSRGGNGEVGATVTASAPIMNLRREGTYGSKWPLSANFELGSFEANISSRTQLDIKLGNGGTSVPDMTVMSLLSNGNVGIGTAAPTTKLDVVGNARVSGLGGAGIQMVVTDNNGVLSRQAIPTVSSSIYTADGTLAGNRTILQGANNLTFKSSTASGITFNAGNVATNNRIFMPTDGLEIQSNDVTLTKSILSVASFGSERFRINGNGNVGIGTTTPSSSLHIGGIPYSSNVNNGITISTAGNQWQGGFSMKSDANGVARMAIETMQPVIGGGKLEVISIPASGRVGIGTTTPTTNLSVSRGGNGEVGATVTASAPIMNLRREGTNGSKWPLSANFELGSFEANINSRTQLDIKLGNGGTLVPDMTVMSLLSNGNVGIGTAAPIQKLDIVGNARVSGLGGAGIQMVVTDNNGVLSRQAIPTNSSNIYTADGTLAGNRTIAQGTNSLTFKSSTASGITFAAGNVATNNRIFMPTDGLEIQSNDVTLTKSILSVASFGSERFRINGNGNVGIGTTTPAANLEVAGTLRIRPANGAGNTAGGYVDINGAGNANSGYVGFHRADGTRNGYIGYDNTNMFYASENGANHIFNGNVGIGTTVPTQKLDVDGQIRLRTGAVAGHVLQSSADGTASWVAPSGGLPNGTAANQIPVWTGSSWAPFTAFRISGSGNVGIGHTNNFPAARLHVVGTFRVASADNSTSPFMEIGTSIASGLDINGGVLAFKAYGSGGTDFPISFESRAGQFKYMRIMPGGNVGIGTVDPAYTLHVNGSVAGTSAYVNLSDKRFKKDVQPIENALSKVMQLNGVTYNWNQDVDITKNFDAKNHIGFLAQDLEKVLPQVVNTADDEMKTKSVAYGDIVPVLVEAIKEMKAENDKLKLQLLNQNSSIDALKVQVETLLPKYTKN